MDGQQKQQDHECAPSLAYRPNPALITLPPDFWETSRIWTNAALKLVISYPNIPDDQFQARVVDALGEIVLSIDEAVESLDLSDSVLPRVCNLLLYQSFALQYKHLLLRDTDSLRHTLHILEILPQLCDSSNTTLSQAISCRWGHFLTLATGCFLDNRCPSEFRFAQLLERLNIPFDFMLRAKSIVERANDISHIPAEVCGCNPQSPLVHDLDWLITSVGDVANHSDPNQDPDLVARLLTVQVMALQARFRLLGDIADLDRFEFVSKTAFKSHPSPSYLSYSALYVFAYTSRHYEHFDILIAIGEELLRCISEETHRLLVSEKLATSLLHRYKEIENSADGERVLQLCEDALPFALGEARPRWLALRARALFRLSFYGRQFPDLRQSLAFINEGLGINEKRKALFLWHQLRNAAISGNEEAAVSALHKIHDLNYAHFEGSISLFDKHHEADILRAVETLKQMCAIRPEMESCKPFAIVLVIALWWRYWLDGDTQSLREAVSLRSRLGPPGLYGLDVLLYGSATRNDFDGVEKRPEVVKALAASSRGLLYQFPEVSGLGTTPGQREAIKGRWKATFSSSIGSETWQGHDQAAFEAMRKSAYERTGNDLGFRITQRELLLQLSASKDNHLRRYIALVSLGDLYSSRYDREGDTKDLEHAVNWYQQCVDILGVDDQTERVWRLRTGWADRLFQLHGVTNSVEYPRLLQALDYYHQAAATTRNTPENRLDAIDGWMSRFPELAEDRIEHLLEICELALSLLEEQSWAASNPRLSFNSRHEKYIGKMIASFAFLAGIHAGGIPKAIELIEASQALVWGQLHRLRVPLDDLMNASPILASRFQQSSQRLQRRMGLLDEDPKEEADLLGMNNWQMNQVMNQVVDEIRAVPGFERFLRRRSFEVDELREVAKDGPVVVLLDEGRALILQQDRHSVVDLPVGYNDLCNLHRSLQVMANTRDSHDGPDLTEESGCSDTHPVADPLNPNRNSRSLRKVGRDAFQHLLEALWRLVVEPILVQMLGCETDDQGRSRKWEVPKLDDRPRIWWCCLGVFSFLPIHAAGVYSGTSPICVSDLFVSSYTPTLTALLDARARPVPPYVKILAAAQPNPGGRWSRLTQVKDELKEIIQVTPPTNIISLSDTGQAEPDYEGRYTTVENVLSKLPEASVLHLACHGTQIATDPFNSGFILADAKTLTIEKLMKYQLPNAHTAILSACHTASNDVEQPDEAINLSSALMFLGFSNILATKWPMNDFDGPIIAKAIYQALFNNTEQSQQSSQDPAGKHDLTLASFSLARVVDTVARHLRLERKVKPERWATFVHVGI